MIHCCITVWPPHARTCCSSTVAANAISSFDYTHKAKWRTYRRSHHYQCYRGRAKSLCSPTAEMEWWQFNGLRAQSTTPLPLCIKDPVPTPSAWRRVLEPTLQSFLGLLIYGGGQIPFKRWHYCAWLQMEIVQPSLSRLRMLTFTLCWSVRTGFLPFFFFKGEKNDLHFDMSKLLKSWKHISTFITLLELFLCRDEKLIPLSWLLYACLCPHTTTLNIHSFSPSTLFQII